jgi:hypothetical protein
MLNFKFLMAYWQFLLQKEGERTWVPLATSNLEIEVGRYRIVAHSDRPNVEVEIRLIHHTTEDGQHQRQSQNYCRRTNSEGLLVVMPFTELQPGKWQIRCCGDIFSEFLGQGWQERLQLLVLPQVQAQLPQCNQENNPEKPSLPQSQVQESTPVTSPPTLIETSAPQLEELSQPTATQLLPETELGDRAVAESSPAEPESTPAAATSAIEASESGPPALDLPQPTKMSKTLKHCQSESNPVLPPKISRSPSRRRRVKLPQLPKLSDGQLKVAASLVANPHQQQEALTSESQRVKSPPTNHSDNHSPSVDQKTTPAVDCFADLHLEERFLSRLDSLAVKEN